MASRFTEHFEINQDWQFSPSEPSSPLSSSTSESLYYSSSETLNVQIISSTSTVTADMYNFKTKSQSSVKSNDPSLVYTHSFSTVHSVDEASHASKPKKSKLKRFLTTIQHSRKSSK
ncbi:uncharacterized protein ATC70_009399 [Mucor velutinosus]|uniref:Uncharacterized protein n=1 Tax=Mucor velutinosus TaxID=708070 RepID=A0AAN7DKL2_9FUNG|nr:hypothetical protein ATC70_009399 [Mucor velutinosus]